MFVDADVKEETRKTTLRSERGSAFKKRLTEPTLLEMSGFRIRTLEPFVRDFLNNRGLGIGVVLDIWCARMMPIAKKQFLPCPTSL